VKYKFLKLEVKYTVLKGYNSCAFSNPLWLHLTTKTSVDYLDYCSEKKKHKKYQPTITKTNIHKKKKKNHHAVYF